MPPTMPPAMAPALELCPATGIGVAVFDAAVLDAALFEVELPGTEVPEGLSIAPGPISGESIEVTRGCERVIRESREKTLTTGGIRFVEVPIVLILKCAVNTLSKKKIRKRTVTSRRAQWGIRVPEGIGLGNLPADVNFKPNRFSARQKLTWKEAGSLCSLS